MFFTCTGSTTGTHGGRQLAMLQRNSIGLKFQMQHTTQIGTPLGLILNCRRRCRRPRCSWHLSCGGGVCCPKAAYTCRRTKNKESRVIWAWWWLLDLQAGNGEWGRWFTLKVTKFHDYTHWALKDYTEIQETVRSRIGYAHAGHCTLLTGFRQQQEKSELLLKCRRRAAASHGQPSVLTCWKLKNEAKGNQMKQSISVMHRELSWTSFSVCCSWTSCWCSWGRHHRAAAKHKLTYRLDAPLRQLKKQSVVLFKYTFFHIFIG